MIKVLIRNKASRRFLVLYYIDPLTGKEVWRSARTADRKEAERAAILWEEELKTHRGERDDGWDHFRNRLRDEYLRTRSKKYRKSVATALNHFARLTPVASLSEITASKASAFQSALLSEGLARTSVASYLTHLRVALKWAQEIGMIRTAPKIPMPRLGRRRFMRGRPITETEYRILLKTCEKFDDGLAWRRFLELLWLTGFRLEEGMRCSWDSPPVRVHLEAQPYPQIIFFEEGQKSRQDEAIPMCPDFAAWLEKTPPKARHGPVAPLPLATSPRVGEFISLIGKETGIEVNEQGKFVSAHDLRRAFGTRWAQLVRPLTLQRLMRHANIETTLKYYVGLSNADAGAELWGSDYLGAQTAPSAAPKKSRKPGKTA